MACRSHVAARSMRYEVANLSIPLDLAFELTLQTKDDAAAKVVSTQVHGRSKHERRMLAPKSWKTGAVSGALARVTAR